MSKKILNEDLSGNISSSSHYYNPFQGLNQNVQNPNIQINPSIPNSSNPISLWNRIDPSAMRKFGAGFEVRSCSSLRPEQQMVVNRLASGLDTYILAAPAVGKTMPVVCYYMDHFLKLNPLLTLGMKPAAGTISDVIFRPEELSKMLWLCPIRSLVDDIEMDFRKDFYSIILQLVNQLIQPNHSINIIQNFTNTNNIMKDMINAMSTNLQHTRIALGLLNQKELLVEQLRQSLINIQNPADSSISKNLAETILRLDTQFYDVLIDLIISHVNTRLVGKKYLNTSDHNLTNKPIIIAVYESAPPIVKNTNNIKVVVFDEAQRTQDINAEERTDQIGKAINDVLSSNEIKSARLVLLSGSNNPLPAQQFCKFLTLAYNRKFADDFKDIGPVVLPGSNPGNIQILPKNNLGDFNTQKQIISELLSRTDSSAAGTVFIMFSLRRIHDLVNALVPEGSFPSVSPRKPIDIDRNKSLFTRHHVKEITNRELNIENIGNPLLRKAISRGLGFIHRQPDELMKAFQYDNQIVQNMFSQGRIKVLLATDAIREGINIKAKTMYLSSTTLPGNREMPLDSLTQLVNRVGREPGNFVIYTPAEDVEKVRQAISAVPGSFEDVPLSISGIKAKSRFGYGITKEVAKEIGDLLTRITS